MGVSVKKLLTLLLSTLVVTGCAQSTEFGEVSSSIRDSQEMQAETDTSQPSVESEAADTDENRVLEADEPSEEEPVERVESTSAPVAYEFSSELVDDEICKLEEDSYPRRTWADVPATGFPLNTYGATVSQFGTAKVKVVFLEWEDLRGTREDYDYHVEELTRANEFYRVVSEGKFGFDISFEQEWILVDGSYQDSYFTDEMTDAGHNSASRIQQRIDKFIAATDEKVDYSDVDVLFFGLPRAATVIESGGLHIFGDGGWVFGNTQEGTVLNIFAFGERVFDNIGQVKGWSWFAHEFGHVLKMPDLRDVSQGMTPNMYQNSPMYGFDIMDNQDSGTQGLSGWMKWLQGWLDDSQVTCVDAATVEEEFYRLDEANIVGGENEMLVVRLSDTKALIVESRRWDSRFDRPISRSRDGVIVYRLDTTRGHEEGPLRLLSPRDITQYLSQENVWPDWRVLDVILFEGDSVNFDGITVQVERLSDEGDVVLITTSRS